MDGWMDGWIWLTRVRIWCLIYPGGIPGSTGGIPGIIGGTPGIIGGIPKTKEFISTVILVYKSTGRSINIYICDSVCFSTFSHKKKGTREPMPTHTWVAARGHYWSPGTRGHARLGHGRDVACLGLGCRGLLEGGAGLVIVIVLIRVILILLLLLSLWK